MAEAPATDARPPIDAAEALQLYRTMCLIRVFEDRVQSLFTQGAIHGTTHLYQGQEAVATGVCGVLGADDTVCSTYRGHGHAIALGVDPQALLDELLGRASGICGGRSGSMNIVDREHRLLGCFGIVGASIAAATGAGLAAQRASGVAVAFFGDGTVNQGYFSECLNFAKVLNLPVVYVCENNLYGEFTPWETVTAGDIPDRVAALGIGQETVDGNDVLAVREAAQAARSAALDGNGPQFLQALTYRYAGHSRTDPGHYRKPGELEAWRARDPLTLWEKRLREEFGCTAETTETVDQEVRRAVDTFAERGLAAPFPTTDDATEYKD